MTSSVVSRANVPAQFDSLQALRGIAALLVVLYHTGTLYAVHTGQVFMRNVFRAGFTGVDVFFVLSGVVIFFAHEADIGKPKRATRFVLRRAFRLLPVYWAVVMLKMLKDPAAVSGTTLLTAVFLVPTAAPFINVSWTLTYELFFYGCFLLMIVLPRGGLSMLPIAVMIVLACAPQPQTELKNGIAQLVDFLFNAHLIEFAFGVGVAWAFRRYGAPRLRVAILMLFCGLAGFAVAAVIGTSLSPQLGQQGVTTAYEVAELHSNAVFRGAVFYFGVPATLVIAGLIALEMQGRLLIPCRRPLVWVGDVSYSLYLTHGFLIHLLLSQTDFRAFASRESWALILAWALALALSWTFYHGIEVPAMRLGRRLSSAIKP